MFTPPGATAAPRLGRARHDRDRRRARPASAPTLRLRRHPDWIKARMPSGEQLPRPQGPAPRPEPQHGLRGGPLPEHRGVLGPAHRHDHDPRRHVHPGLRLLRRQDRPPDLVRRRRAAPRRRGGRRARASSTSSSPASPATTCPTAARGSSPRRSSRCARRARDGHRGPDPGLRRRRRPAADRHGRPAGHPQPQPRDREAAPEAGPQARPLGPHAVRPRAGPRRWPSRSATRSTRRARSWSGSARRATS